MSLRDELGVAVERAELFALFLAALEAVVPDVTNDQRAMVRDVVERMIRERTDLAQIRGAADRRESGATRPRP